jgi:hypothetical protein
METYKFIKLDNGNILLEKIIIDNTLLDSYAKHDTNTKYTKYTIVNKDNGDILLQLNRIINIQDIKNYNFCKSIILDCKINDNNFTKLKYTSILGEIYNIINDGTTIIKNTKLNIKTIIKEDEGFRYLDNIGISVQCVESNKCLLEISNQCIKNKIKLSIKIKLVDENIIDMFINEV